MSTPNIPLLRKAVEWAETEHAKGFETVENDYGEEFRVPMGAWNQGIWIAASPHCGTAYCIAGYVAAMHDARYDNPGGCGFPVEESGEVNFNEPPARQLAIEVLNLNSAQATKLFAGGNTIEDVRQIAEEIAGEAL